MENGHFLTKTMDWPLWRTSIFLTFFMSTKHSFVSRISRNSLFVLFCGKKLSCLLPFPVALWLELGLAFCTTEKHLSLPSKCSKVHFPWGRTNLKEHGRIQGEGAGGAQPPPPEMTCGFLINTVQSASQLYKICFIIWYVFSAVHIMLLPSRKPSSSYSLLKFVYVTSQLRHSLVVHPLLRKILDPPLRKAAWVASTVWAGMGLSSFRSHGEGVGLLFKDMYGVV